MISNRALRLLHFLRRAVQRLRPIKPFIVALAPRPLTRWYHELAVRLEFDPKRFPTRTLPPGLNVIGYLRSASGVGESARSFAQLAHATGIPVALYNALGGPGAVQEDDSLGTLQQENPYDVNLFCVNASEMMILRENLGGAFFANRKNIGYWYWEFPELPRSYVRSYVGLSEIWVATSFVRDAVEKSAPPDHPVPAFVIPPWVRMRKSSLSKEEAGFRAGRFSFLTLADAGSVLERKNPEGAIRAFLDAFGKSRDVELVVKINHPDANPSGVRRLKEMAREGPIRVVDELLSRAEIDALLVHCDCLVSLHRSEGFGLPCAEAMALGKPVIATDYSGTTDFLCGRNGYPVPYRMGRLPVRLGPYEAGWPWAEPDLDAAAEILRSVVEDPAQARARGEAAASSIQSRYGRMAVAESVAARFGSLRAER